MKKDLTKMGNDYSLASVGGVLSTEGQKYKRVLLAISAIAVTLAIWPKIDATKIAPYDIPLGDYVFEIGGVILLYYFINFLTQLNVSLKSWASSFPAVGRVNILLYFWRFGNHFEVKRMVGAKISLFKLKYNKDLRTYKFYSTTFENNVGKKTLLPKPFKNGGVFERLFFRHLVSEKSLIQNKDFKISASENPLSGELSVYEFNYVKTQVKLYKLFDVILPIAMGVFSLMFAFDELYIKYWF